jgi:hypothetical protein
MKNEGTEAKLTALQSLGFIFRIPGGKSRKGDHSSFCITSRYSKDGLEILVIPYSTTKVIIQLQEEEIFEEEVEGALELKIIEQTGVLIKEYIKIGEQKGKNNNENIDAEDHMKYLFRTDTYDDSNIRQTASPNKKTDIPLWVEYELAKKFICQQHQWMLGTFDDEVLAPRLKEHEPVA